MLLDVGVSCIEVPRESASAAKSSVTGWTRNITDGGLDGLLQFMEVFIWSHRANEGEGEGAKTKGFQRRGPW